MANVYSDENQMLKDYARLKQEYQNKAGRFIKNLLKIQRAETGLQGKVTQWENAKRRSQPAQQDAGDGICCSFCGRSQHMAQQIIAGRGVYICDDCVRLCGSILTDVENEALAKGADGK